MKFRHILLSAIILAAPQADAQTFSNSLRGVASANRKATAEPAAKSFINAIQVYPFADGAIFQVYAAPGLVTDIALQPGETLVAVASGDTTRWVPCVIMRQSTRRPMAPRNRSSNSSLRCWLRSWKAIATSSGPATPHSGDRDEKRYSNATKWDADDIAH